MSDSDHELMSRFSAGDAEAFAQLVRRWEGRVGGLLARLAPEENMRDDLCQEVFLRVMRARDRYQPRGAFSTWLYRIVLNIARDAARRRRPIESTNGHAVTTRESSPAACAEIDELRHHVHQALEELPEPLREALILKHFSDLTFPQIAELTQAPVSTVKSRTKKAHELMRASLARRGVRNRELPE